MERIISNEIYRLIKREPSQEELESAMKYLDSCADDLTYGESIPELVEDWLRDEMKQCAYCGSWMLKSEMYEDGYDYFCDEGCANEGIDLHAEARAEYESQNR